MCSRKSLSLRRPRLVWFLAQRTYGEEEKMNLKETAFLALLFRTPYLA